MLMYLDPIVGQLTSVVEKDGFFFLLLKVILFMTGKRFGTFCNTRFFTLLRLIVYMIFQVHEKLRLQHL